MNNKKAAIELSIGTIVIVVLAMSMLILGLVLIKTIFSGATDISTMTNEQLKSQVSAIFGEDKKVVIYPDSRMKDISQGKIDGFGIGIRNLIEGSSATYQFSYIVRVSDPDIVKKCGVGISENDLLGYITTGKAENNIPIAPGDISVGKVLFNVPVGSPLCTVRFRVEVKANGNPYASELIDITFKAK